MALRHLKIFVLLTILVSNLYGQTYFRGDEIKQKLEVALRERVGYDAEIMLPRIISDYSFPQKNVELKFDFGNQVLSGNVFIAIEFWSNNTKLRRVELPVRIKLVKEVLVAKTTITKGEKITSENCIFEKKEIPSNVDPRNTDLELVYDKVAKYNIIKGTIITKDLVQEPFAVRRGERVKVVVLSGKVQISTYAVALNDANAGEQVKVRREGNGAILVGLATTDGNVVIAK